ncbi:MAG: hypothetical protein ACI3X9_01660 [Bacteroidaceae bacterium]
MKEETRTTPPTTPLHLHGSDNQANHFQAEKIDTVENIVENYNQKYEFHMHLPPGGLTPCSCGSKRTACSNLRTCLLDLIGLEAVLALLLAAAHFSGHGQDLFLGNPLSEVLKLFLVLTLMMISCFWLVITLLYSGGCCK